MSERISIDAWFIEMAKVVALRGTCARRKVGCILVNARNQVLSTGYNGTARGMDHCIDVPCGGARGFSSGQGLEVCEAIHAEMNAILQCRDVEEIATCYSTDEPCIHCTKLLMNTGCSRVVSLNLYAGAGADLWCRNKPGESWTFAGKNSV